jgi:hypothetical protein
MGDERYTLQTIAWIRRYVKPYAAETMLGRSGLQTAEDL